MLEHVRAAIRRALPRADEVISYQVPAYRIDGAALVYFAGWKCHYAVYPATERLLEAFCDQLASYEVGKGTIRFPLAQPAPVGLIARIAKFRSVEAIEGTLAKAAPPRSRPTD